MPRYYLVKENRGSGCLIGLILAVFVLVIVLYAASYVLPFLAGVILISACAIGAVLTIKNFFRALRDSVAVYARSLPPSRRGTAFLHRWIMIAWGTLKDGWAYNFADMKKALTKGSCYGLLSFRRWVNYLSVVALLFGGCLITILLVAVHINLLGLAFLCVLALFCLMCLLFVLVGASLAIGDCAKTYFQLVVDSFRSDGSSVSEYVLSCGYREWKQILENSMALTKTQSKQQFAQAQEAPWLSVKRWMCFFVGMMDIFAGFVVLLVLSILHIAVLSVLFCVFRIRRLFLR